ncbi:unnamed protein product [Didymodactylos carnosus]|uniref:Enoyl reductase (ER) domain-containing protein n=1 Tax=Didymodactylos carnosus TaxID=1234261 RepID=A0A814SJG9_9BILA|nr:unnamed protein product [Didymodactylos carnosus]CAF1148388.1 unnamed protein product [Didymodactylos carnosus]CAF3771344.1 unnamed protein product [Didymodactylos carnosus]CAF3911967.1 unnamed protein product [Didymodactylos carnosus]
MVEVPIPTTCADDEVLVQISHVSLNSAIAYRLIAYYGVLDPVGALISRPCVPEIDFSGIVCDLRGTKVKDFNTGDRVFGIGPIGFRNVGHGVLREYILAKHDHMTKVPDNISLKDAACFPATGYTAYCFLVEKAKLKKGDRVFINGGSGAVGVMAIQLARTIVGSTGLVVATCSPAKTDIIRNLGADEEHYSSRPFDVILDTVGNDHALYSNSPAYLTPAGLFCTIGMVEIGSTVWSATKRLLQLLSAMIVPVYLGGVPRRHIFEPLNIVHSRFVAMAQLVEEGAFKAVIDSTYKFTDALDAYDRVMSRKVTGKVVIEVNDLE